LICAYCPESSKDDSEWWSEPDQGCDDACSDRRSQSVPGGTAVGGCRGGWRHKLQNTWPVGGRCKRQQHRL